MNRWEGKVALVTGSTGGMGTAIASALAEAGLKVVGLDVNVAKEGLQTVGKGTIETIKCNIADLEQLKAVFSRVEKFYGGVDVMVNCAGYATLGHITSVGTDQIAEEEIVRILDVNFKALVFLSRFAVDSMKKRGVDGHIVNINSIAGHYVSFSDKFNVYSSTKYAVTAFTQSLAQELAYFKNKIKTTSISPGLVQTPLSSGFVTDFTAVPVLQPSDIAAAVLYALSTPPHVNITELTVQPVAEIRQ